MNCGKYLAALLFVFFAFAPLAFSQDAVIVFDHKEVGPHQRPLVSFDHDRHSTGIECLRCHHDYDEHGNNKGGDGQPCTACHGGAKAKASLPLEKALHIQCKRCHEDLRAQGAQNVPIMCGECHVNN